MPILATRRAPSPPTTSTARTAAAAVLVSLLGLLPVAMAHGQTPAAPRDIAAACRDEARMAEPFADVATDAVHGEAIGCVWAYDIAQAP